MNAKEEFLDLIEGLVLVAAEIRYVGRTSTLILDLAQGHTQQQLDALLDALDFRYDNGYGAQYIYGTVWFADGTWADRGEYDGSEWWDFHTCPAIPAHLSSKSADFPPAPPQVCHVI